MRTSRHGAIASIVAGLTLPPALVRAQPVTTVRILAPPTEQMLPFAYAQRAGLFDRAGLKVELSRSTSGAATAAALAAGAADIGLSSILGVVLGYARGVPFTIVAPSGLWTPGFDGGVLVPTASPLRTAKDLEGKTFSAAAVNDITLLGLRAWMDQNGADSTSVKIVEIPQAAAPVALEQGRVDAIMVSDPAYTLAIASGKARRLVDTYIAIAPRFLLVCWFSTSGWVERNRATAERFGRVIADAATYASSHVDETLDDLVQLTGLDRALCQRMHRTPQTPAVLTTDLQPVIDVAVRYKALSKPFAAKELISDAAVKS